MVYGKVSFIVAGPYVLRNRLNGYTEMNNASAAARAVSRALTSAIETLSRRKPVPDSSHPVPSSPHNAHSVARHLFANVLLVGGMAGIFLLDVVTPLGFTVWMLYLLPLWLVARHQTERSPSLWWTAGASMLLTIAGFWLSPAGGSPWLAGINRSIGILVLGLSTLFLCQLIGQREAIRRNEEELRDFVEGASVGLHWVGPDGTILWANQAELDLFGYAPDEYIGRSIRQFHADGDIADDILRRLKTGETLHNFEVRLRCKDGSIKHVSMDSDVSWRDGRFSHCRCFVRDLTAEKKADRLQARLAAIVTHSENAIVSFTPDGVIDIWNKGAERLLGWTEAEALGQVKWMFVPESHMSESHELVQAVAQGQSVRNLETQRKRKNGSVVDVSITMSPVMIHNQVVSVCEILHDITDRKRSEQFLRAANKELESFSYSVSHDLRAPLRSIDGFAKVLVEDFGPSLPAEARRYLTIIQKGAGRMGELIDDLLEFSRLSRSTLNRQPVDPKRVIREAWLELRRQDPERQVELMMGDMPKCLADGRLIKQVWMNLLSNALKYSRPRQESRIEVGWHEDEQQPGHVVYWIRDNGVGFDQQYVDKLFGVFQRLHRAEDFEGTGVGLAIVHRIIQRHGGRVWAEGRLNKGATFYFMLERVHEHDGAGQRLGLVGRG
jgi:PAS domain S-box-containing protein